MRWPVSVNIAIVPCCSMLTDPCLLLACLRLFPEREHLVSKGAKMLSEVASKQASSEITLFERYTITILYHSLV